MERFEEKELDRILRLSGLSLSEEERQLLFSDLSRIVPYMQRITALAEVAEEASKEETSAEKETLSFLREDEDIGSGLSEEILQQAPARMDSAFTVPRTVE